MYAQVVWASCADCAEPTAAITLLRGQLIGDSPSTFPGAVEVPMSHGRGATFVPPTERSAISHLYTTDDGGAPLVFAGWGLDQDQFVAVAEAATTPGATMPDGLVLVYEGPTWASFPDTTPTRSNLHIGYASATGSEWLSYDVLYDGTTWPADTRPSLMSLAWASPEPVLTQAGEELTIAFGPAPTDGGQQTMFVRSTTQLDR